MSRLMEFICFCQKLAEKQLAEQLRYSDATSKICRGQITLANTYNRRKT